MIQIKLLNKQGEVMKEMRGKRSVSMVYEDTLPLGGKVIFNAGKEDILAYVKVTH